MTGLRAEGIVAGYGRVEVLHGVDIAVPKGQVITLIGANGAGKTTLLTALMGLMPTRGRITFEGQDVTRLSPEARVAAGISLVSEQRDLFGRMSVADNLRLGGFIAPKAIPERLDEVFQRFPKLKERRAQRADTLSGGERQMLAMGRALMARPKLLMLDEPSLGLAPLIVRDIFEIIRTLRTDGISILLVEQNARAALNVADRGYVMDLGEIVLEDTPETLLTDRRLIDTYLGSGAE